ncbi:Trm112 family protein [Sodalis sp. CWE]|uniref:Trm112 family protein n=1 Tax=Sodalis sp. CWE TaxID=2803816 RepID=UPI001C7E133A|nr:Trm112 family protein [Sodalis sp. CWE]MBX4181134.1 Trm112 family protein [Sodalis sp. CWE]
MDYRLLEIIACPVCTGQLYYDKEHQELICKSDALAYPFRNGIPVLLKNKARSIDIKTADLITKTINHESSIE